MTISLVTGGAGMIGSHVVDHLLKMGHQVVILDDLSGGSIANLPADHVAFTPEKIFPHGLVQYIWSGGLKESGHRWQSQFIEASILDAELVERIFNVYKPDFVFHLAAYAAESLSHHIRRFNYETNVIGSVNLINAAVNYGVKRFVFTSSVAVYGLNAHGADEHQTPTPIDPYGIAKWTVEQDLIAASRMFDLPITIFRPGNVYGPRQNLSDGYRNAVGIFISQALKGQPFTIYGAGEQTRQFTYIDDVTPYIARCVEQPMTENQVYNLGSDISCSVNMVARFVENSFNKSIERIRLPERFEARDVRVDHEKADRVFEVDQNKKMPLASGVHRMVEWAKTQKLEDPKPFTAIEIEKGLPEHWRKLNGQK